MIVAIARAQLHLPASRSLKDKRRVIKSLVDKCHRGLRVSVAETDYHDLHQRSELGIALVHRDRFHAEQILEQIHQLIAERPESELIAWDADLVEDFDE